MPRQLLLDRHIVADPWHYAEELGADAKAEAIILGFDQWQAERDAWIARGCRLGVVLLPEHKAEQLAADLSHLSLVASHFPGPSDGRGYTQARLLRERFEFDGEIRAVGYVRLDQLFFLARCGFNSFEMTDEDMPKAASKFSIFTAAYQPTNDRGLAAKLPPA